MREVLWREKNVLRRGGTGANPLGETDGGKKVGGKVQHTWGENRGKTEPPTGQRKNQQVLQGGLTEKGGDAGFHDQGHNDLANSGQWNSRMS